MAASKWSLDYSLPSNKASSSSSSLTPLDPPGYIPALTGKNKSNPDPSALIKPANLDSLRQQKAWELALAPAKNVPMQAFMMYMTGGGVQIFSVMSVWFLLKQALSGLFGVSKAFQPFTSTTPTTSGAPSRSLTQQKLTFAACQLALLAVGLWKCNSMGLLPTHQSDWLAFSERVEVGSGLAQELRGRVWEARGAVGGWV